MNFRRVHPRGIVKESWAARFVADSHIINCSTQRNQVQCKKIKKKLAQLPLRCSSNYSEQINQTIDKQKIELAAIIDLLYVSFKSTMHPAIEQTIGTFLIFT